MSNSEIKIRNFLSTLSTLDLDVLGIVGNTEDLPLNYILDCIMEADFHLEAMKRVIRKKFECEDNLTPSKHIQQLMMKNTKEMSTAFEKISACSELMTLLHDRNMVSQEDVEAIKRSLTRHQN